MWRTGRVGCGLIESDTLETLIPKSCADSFLPVFAAAGSGLFGLSVAIVELLDFAERNPLGEKRQVFLLSELRIVKGLRRERQDIHHSRLWCEELGATEDRPGCCLM